MCNSFTTFESFTHRNIVLPIVTVYIENMLCLADHVHGYASLICVHCFSGDPECYCVQRYWIHGLASIGLKWVILFEGA